MTHPFGRPLVVANPAAGGGRGATLRRLRAALDAREIGHDLAVTAGRGHATELVRRALEDGRRYLVAVGGDGTVHEVVNGLVDAETGQPRVPDAVLGIVSAGSGCDLVRTFGLNRPPEVLADHLATEAVLPIDLGRLRFQGRDGTRRSAVFANVAEAGFGGQVVSTAARLPARLGPSRYLAAIVVAWGRFRRIETTVRVDAGARTEALCNVLLANGQFYGGGLHVAPRALPTDGTLDVQAWGGTPTDVVRAARLLRTGAHLARPDVRAWRSTTVHVDAARPLLVEADGELLGTTPLEVDVLPGVVTLKL